MSVYFSLDSLPDTVRGGAVTIGNFDGVHRGHQALIKALGETKNKRSKGVLTFSPHFVEYLQPERKLFRLSSDTQKAELLKRYGADFVVIQKLSQEFLSMSPADFIKIVLREKLACTDLVVGDDFCFGARAEGRLKDLACAADEGAFKLHVIKSKTVAGERCSSSAIRKYLSEGNLLQAQNMLGRPFSLRGQVSKGQGIAQGLGFGTANIIPEANFGLARGVYATITRVNNQNFISATNVGVRPSVSATPILTIETHCLDQKLDLASCELEIFFLKHIRPEIKFESLDALKDQVQKDLTHIRAILSGYCLKEFCAD